MNYKDIIKSRDLRIKILSYLGWIPDGIMLRFQYWLQTGRILHLKNPQRFTEKLQVYKMRYRNPDMLRCTDKYEVRGYVEEKGLEDCLIPLIGLYNKVEDIDFMTLPNQFVAKTTDGGGGNQVLICRDKRELSEAEFRNRLSGWMKMPKKKQVGREWAYENHFPRRIIIEKLIGNNTVKGLPDYKFFCFDGQPLYCQLIQGRTSDLTIDFYDMEWQRMSFTGLTAGVNCSNSIVDKPVNFEEMKAIATRLSNGYPFVRVDLYNVEGTTFFGELTFYPSSGYGNFTPDEWDERLGELLNIPENQLVGGVNI